MPGIHDEIRTTLAGLGLEQVRTVANLITKKVQPSDGKSSVDGGLPTTLRRFIVGSAEQKIKMEVGKPLELEADAVICDSLLGTLGLVHVLSSDPKSVATRVATHIDRATYLSHLLLDSVHPGDAKAPTVYSVEIVLAIPSDPVVACPETCAGIGEVLRRLMAASTFLQVAGINVWMMGGPDERQRHARVRRAFSWLLHDTMNWWAEHQRDKPNGALCSNGAKGSLAKLTLSNYRVPGCRTCTIVGPESYHQPLHVVHGPNGSGKSSIAEAVELATAHSVERLENQNHAKIVTNSDAWRRRLYAGIQLEFTDGRLLFGMVGRNRIRWKQHTGWAPTPAGWPFLPSCPAASVRLDQKLADVLSQSPPQQRAGVLLRAFFKDEYEQIRKSKSAACDAELLQKEFLNKLPTALREKFANEKGEFDPERVLKELVWLGPTSVVWEKFLELVGFYPGKFQAVSEGLEPQARDYIFRTGTVSLSDAEAAAEKVMGGLQKYLATMAPLKPHLEDAAKVLDSYGMGIQGSVDVPASDPVKALNDWLEAVALEDLLGQAHRILRTVELAQESGYQGVAVGWLKALRLNTTGASVAEREKLLAQQQEQASRLLAAIRTRPTTSPSRGVPLVPIEQLNPESLDKLASAGVFGPAFQQLSRPLSSALRKALGDHKPQEISLGGTSSLRVGESGWGVPLAQKIHAILEFLPHLPTNPQVLDLPKVLVNLRRMRDTAETLAKASKEAHKKLSELLREDGLLSCAINEVVALLTPARWAYEDTISKLNLDGTAETLEFRARDGVPASLRLNTAELNALALSMFLLCARLSPNPLRLVVLDDPLQNMDELTVTTVARGLGKLMRLWKEWDREEENPWRVLLLLHSEEDVERIRNEIPCVTHVLKWLSPDGQADLERQDLHVKRDSPLLAPELQPLEEIITGS